MKKIFFIVNYLILDEEGGNSRFLYLAKKLLQSENLNIEIITSNFFHAKKKFRNEDEKNLLVGDKQLKITFLSELGYKKNVSTRRTFSNKMFARSVSHFLDKRKAIGDLPDLIYFSVPSLEYGAAITKFAKKNEISTIADIQDIWPEAFEMVSPFPKCINNVLFFNSKRLSNTIYSNATKTVAVSNTYGKVIDKYRTTGLKTDVVYLGSDFGDFDKYFKKKVNTTNIVKFVYVGTIGHSYDLSHVLEAFQIIKDSQKCFEFHIFGDGPLKKSMEDKSKNLNLSNMVTFHGRLAYTTLIGKLGEMDVAINPIRDGAAQSIINKVGDYAAAALPVINTQENAEYRKLVQDYKIGINTINDSEEIAKILLQFIEDKERISEFGKNNRRLGEELFDRRRTYQHLCKVITDTLG